MSSITKTVLSCPFCLKLITTLKKVLCFCHTSNAAILAISLMNPLGLSRGALIDGFPMLHDVFSCPSISHAIDNHFKIGLRAWPLKDGYPAIAFRRAQVLTYSLDYFMVSPSFLIHLPSSFPTLFSFFSVLLSLFPHLIFPLHPFY